MLSASVMLAAAVSAETIKIGVAGPFTGANAAFGEQLWKGAEKAAADLNKAGGINGKQIELIKADDACEPKQAVAVAQRMVDQDKVAAVVGHFCSSSSIPASEIYNEAGIIQITPASTNPKFTDRNLPYVFRTCGRDDQQGSVAGMWLVKKIKAKRIAIIHDKDTYGQGLADATKATINKMGVKEVLYEGLTRGEKDFNALVTKIKSLKADAVYFGGLHGEAGPLVRQMREQGLKTTAFVSGDGITSLDFINAAGGTQYTDGVYMTFGADATKLPIAKKVVDEFRASGYEPEGYTLYSYSALQAIAAALNAGKGKTADAAKYLKSKTVKTVMGDKAWDKKGDLKARSTKKSSNNSPVKSFTRTAGNKNTGGSAQLIMDKLDICVNLITQQPYVLIQQLLNGLTLGSIYGLIAIGYTMVYGIIGMINFAHGDVYMVSAYLTAISIAVLTLLGVSSIPAVLVITLLITVFITAILGYSLNKIAYKPLRNSTQLAPLISAIGMSLILQNFMQISQGARTQGIPTLIDGILTVGTASEDPEVHQSFSVTYVQIMIIVSSVLGMATLTYIIQKTKLGRQCRATQQDRKMAQILGIDTERIISTVFVLGASMAAMAGMLVTMNYGSFDFFIGFVIGIKAFTAAVLGGIGSLPGAMLGGLVLGMSESLFSACVNSDYKDVFAFLLLVTVMIFKPTGFLGKPAVAKV
ncbi:hypothetical protein CHS0354_013122 [Potamilus streckersoni]|uniref:Leucine-binding protein domain-containing protein n=1 Tax=Potamilus streckersoni TaxID=2493646 RepID=A0AAE0VR60_9BIVA|nr:hypothetical protein CHS0354_013122 [Potamilus streckersoni]